MKKKTPATNSRSKPREMTQAEIRRSVRVGKTFAEVSPVSYWYRHGFFRTEEAAQAAFELAYQQAQDGMGQSHAHWMGLTEDEFSRWMSSDELPRGGPTNTKKWREAKAAADAQDFEDSHGGPRMARLAREAERIARQRKEDEASQSESSDDSRGT